MNERLRVTGYYAGPASRLAAAAVDVTLVFALYTLTIAGIGLLGRVIFGVQIGDGNTGVAWVIALAVWAFFYVFVGLAVAGRTPGKSLVGLRVVTVDGSPLSVGRALGRTLAFPLSALFLGIGFLGVIFQREHRALHDMLAKTAVVYDWGTRVAELPGPLSAFIARQAGNEYSARPVARR